MAVEQVFIEFVTDGSQLAPAIDQLEAMGKIDKTAAQIFRQTNVELQKRNQQLAAVGVSTAKIGAETTKTKKTIQDLDKSVKQVSNSFIEGFQEGVLDALKEAGVTAEQFSEALATGNTEVEKSSESLRKRLRNLTEQLAELKLEGADNTEQYKKLTIEAGNLKDAIGDAAQEIRNAGSDTSTFDGLINAAQGVAGGFAVAQGAAALFGDESEELQETLLRVNAAMAILQGLQQVQTVLLKESAASRLADVIATRAQTAAQTVYNFVVGASTGLLKAFRIALAATGVGLLIIGLIELVQALNQTDDALERVNGELERNQKLIDADLNSINNRVEKQIAQARLLGRSESDLIAIRGRGLQEQRKVFEESNKELARQAEGLEQTEEAYINLDQAIQKNNESIKEIDQQLIIESLAFEKQLADERKENIEKRKKDEEDAANKARALRDQLLQDEIAAIERRLLVVQEGSEEELNLQKKLIVAKANLDLNAEQLTQNEKKLIQERSFKDRQVLQRQFDEKVRADAIANQISLNNAEIALLKTSDDDKLLLQISNIEFAAQQEIDAAEGNGAKIKQIIAKRDAEIRDAKKKFIDEAAAYEIAVEETKNAALRRQLERSISDPKNTLQAKIAAIDQLLQIELRAGETRLNALNSEYASGLISLKDYNLKYAQLIEEQVKIVEDAEFRKKLLRDKGAAEGVEKDKERIALLLQTAQQVGGLFSALADSATQAENQRIQAERKRVEEQLQAGQITEKESINRLKRIDAEERRIKRLQAKRDKELAIFNAIIATAAGVAKASPVIPLMILAGALGAAQVAIIAARPLPQFSKGKKDSYEGYGEIAETGPEILERGGKKYIVEKRQVVWLNKTDKVYNPKETIAIMNKQMPAVNKTVMGLTVNNGTKQKDFDYERLGKEISKSIPAFGLNVNEQGFKEWVKQGNSVTNYLNNRRSF